MKAEFLSVGWCDNIIFLKRALTVTVTAIRQNALVNYPRFQFDHSRACHGLVKAQSQYLKHTFN